MWTPELISEQELAKESCNPQEATRQALPCSVGVKMTQETYDSLRSYCYRHEIPMSLWIRQAVRRELKRCLAAEEDE